MSHIDPSDIERVLDTAGELFSRHGFDRVTMHQIAEASGVKKASIFYHFGSKASLYEEILAVRYQSITTTLKNAVRDRGSDPDKKLEGLLSALFDSLSMDSTSLRLLQRDFANAVSNDRFSSPIDDDSDFINLSIKILESSFDDPIERRMAFSLGFLTVGFCGLAAVIPQLESKRLDAHWHAEQRDNLITALVSLGKQMLRS